VQKAIKSKEIPLLVWYESLKRLEEFEKNRQAEFQKLESKAVGN
jgi:hypothetical protein